MRKIVVIESPFGGEVCTNVAYARACLADSLRKGESPIASHMLYTQPGILDDNDPEDRKAGIEAGWAFHHVASLVAVYTDRGISNGMKEGIEHAKSLGVEIEERQIVGHVWDDYAFAFPPGSAEAEDGDLVSRAALAREIRVRSVTARPVVVRLALEGVSTMVETFE